VASLLDARARELNRQRDFVRAAETYRKALEIRRALPGVPHDTLASTLVGLAGALVEMGEVDEAHGTAREALGLHEAGGTEGSAGHVAALGQLAYAARRAGDDAEAEVQYRRLLEVQLGETSVYRTARATTLNNLAQLLRGQGRLAEAEGPMRESLEILRAELDPADRTLSVSYNNLTALLAELGRLDAAAAIAGEHLELTRRTFPADHWRVGSAHNIVATVRERQGSWAEAEVERARQLVVYAAGLGPDHSWTARSRIQHASVLAELGRLDDAEVALRAALASIPRIDDIPDTSALEAEARAVAERLAGLRGNGGV
jgi:tetratricopeptide (TPR) repeat protein